jgi:hypothetical protein
MSSTPETSTSTPAGKGATFTFVLGAFAAFAVLLSLFQAWKGETPSDPRAADRLAFAAEIQKAQNELIGKMGISDKAKAAALFAKTAETLKAKAPAASKTVVPGSPTQLKMAPPAAPAAAHAAPATPAAAPTAK